MVVQKRKVWKLEGLGGVTKISGKVGSRSWKHITGALNPADTATRECRPNVLPQLWFHGPGFLKSPNEKWPVFEAGNEESRSKLTVNALSMKESNGFGIGKIIDCFEIC